MSYRISILEFSKHNEIVWSFLKIILTRENQVDVFVNEFVYHQLYDFHKDARIQWFIKPEGLSSSEFISLHRSHLLTRDRLLFTSVPPRDLKMFEDRELASISSLLIYNLHFYASEFHDINEDVNVVNMIKGQFTSQRKYIKTAFAHVDQILVPSKQIFDYAMHNNINGIDGFLNVSVLNKLKKRKAKKKLRIVVPGRISSARKNYEPIFKALSVLNELELDKKINVTFLGMVDNKQVGQRLNELAAEINGNIEIEHFPAFVPQKNFNKIMKKSDFLILPIAERMEDGLVKESYGFSTVSGCISDMVKFGKPALLPSFYPLDHALESMTKRYNSEDDLIAILQDWVDNQSFQDLSVEEYKAYLPKAQADTFFNTIIPKRIAAKKHVA